MIYLQNANTLEEIISFGIDPLIEFLHIFENEIFEELTPGSRKAILWTEIIGKACTIKERSEKITLIECVRAKR